MRPQRPVGAQKIRAQQLGQFAGSGAPQPIAVVVLSPAARAQDEATLTAALAALRTELNAGLDPHERLDRLVVAADEWTIDNGLLTPTMKLKRALIEERFSDLVEAMYEGR